MGMGELEDAELADTIFCVGANSLENQINYFLAHWVPNMRGTSLGKKQAMLSGEELARARALAAELLDGSDAASRPASSARARPHPRVPG